MREPHLILRSLSPTVGLSSLVTVALDTLPGTRSLDQDTRRTMASKVSLDFVFFTDSDSLHALRRAMPARGWVTPDTRGVMSTEHLLTAPSRPEPVGSRRPAESPNQRGYPMPGLGLC